jgi:hypothetical protein
MKRRMAVSALAGAAMAADLRTRFIGVWRLVSCERRWADGRVDYPYGPAPVGRITYDKAGRMSAQLMTPGRKTTVPAGMNMVLGKASTEEMREALAGFASYFGTFDVDEKAQTVIHHVQAALVPSWVGTDLRRTYRFSGNRLALTASLGSTVTELIWEREAD